MCREEKLSRQKSEFLAVCFFCSFFFVAGLQGLKNQKRRCPAVPVDRSGNQYQCRSQGVRFSSTPAVASEDLLRWDFFSVKQQLTALGVLTLP